MQLEFHKNVKFYLFIYSLFKLVTSIVGIILVPFWLVFGWYFCNRFYNTLNCKVHANKLYFSEGWFIKVSKVLLIANVQDIEVISGPLLEYFGLTEIIVKANGVWIRLLGAVNPNEFQEKLLLIRDHAQSIAGPNELLLEIKNLLEKNLPNRESSN